MPPTSARDDALARVREIALSLPEATERESHGAPCFFVRQRPQFCSFSEGEYYLRGGTYGLWCPAPPGAQEEMVRDDPARFFVPPYVGHRGWLGLRLDVDPDWDEVRQLVTEAYRHVAPRTLAARLDD